MIKAFNITDFDAVSLQQLNEVALMRRIDNKYVFSLSKVEQVLEHVVDDYQVLEIDNQRLMPYSTLYYDTPNLDLYKLHQHGKSNRYKVRERTYLNSSASFLEIKLKTNKGKTIKERTPIVEVNNGLENYKSSFIRKHSSLLAEELEPVLWVDFNRITFVSKARNERATLDTGLIYRFNGNRHEVQQVAIFETKRSPTLKRTPMMEALKANGVRPGGFSKYCFGIPLIHPNVKQNALKKKQLLVRKIQQEKT